MIMLLLLLLFVVDVRYEAVGGKDGCVDVCDDRTPVTAATRGDGDEKDNGDDDVSIRCSREDERTI